MPRITISYRREDPLVITGRIFDRLIAHYGREAIFRDIDNIPLGVDFRDHVNRTIDKSDVVLAIVGPRWIGQRGNTSRLANDADPVRVEIEAVLRKGVPLIPVLVLGATMPRADQLPEPLKNFAYRNAPTVDAGPDFDVHMGWLIRALDGLLGTGTDAGATEQSASAVQGRRAAPAPAEFAEARAVSVPGRPKTVRWIGAILLAAAGVIGGALSVPGVREQLWPPPSASAPAADLTHPNAVKAEQKAGEAERQKQEEIERQTQAKAERERQAEAERQKQAEAGRQKQAEAERQKQAEAERQKQAEAERQRAAQAERQKQAEAQSERTEMAKREQQAYDAAKGNAAALRLYLTMCRVCPSASDAQSEMARLDGPT